LTTAIDAATADDGRLIEVLGLLSVLLLNRVQQLLGCAIPRPADVAERAPADGFNVAAGATGAAAASQHWLIALIPEHLLLGFDNPTAAADGDDAEIDDNWVDDANALSAAAAGGGGKTCSAWDWRWRANALWGRTLTAAAAPTGLHDFWVLLHIALAGLPPGLVVL